MQPADFTLCLVHGHTVYRAQDIIRYAVECSDPIGALERALHWLGAYREWAARRYMWSLERYLLDLHHQTHGARIALSALDELQVEMAMWWESERATHDDSDIPF